MKIRTLQRLHHKMIDLCIPMSKNPNLKHKILVCKKNHSNLPVANFSSFALPVSLYAPTSGFSPRARSCLQPPEKYKIYKYLYLKATGDESASNGGLTSATIHLFDKYVMTTFLAWKPRSHEPRRKAIGSRFMRTRLSGRGEICDVIIEMVHYKKCLWWS
jgi:hypothetical protein